MARIDGYLARFSNYENPIITIGGYEGETLRIRVLDDGADESFTVVNWRNVSTIGMGSTFEYTIILTDAERQALWANMGNRTVARLRVTLASISGGITFYSDANITYSIVNANPILSCAVVDTNEASKHLTGNDDILIKYVSTAKVTFEATPQMGAAIDESFYIIRNGDKTVYANEGTFAAVESNEFIVSAEDSRGNITTKSFYAEMVDYIPLTVNIVDDRPDALGNVTIACNGNYFNNTFGAVQNTITAKCTYNAVGEVNGDWIDMEINHYSENTYYASADITIENFDQNQMYEFTVWVEDKIYSLMVTSDKTKSMPIFHWGENDFVFEVPVTFNAGINNGGASGISDDGDQTVNGSLNVTGNMRLKGTGNYGNHLLFGDSNYCYIAELTDDVMTIHATKINLDASSGVFVDGYAIPILDKGIWTPSLNSSAVSSYTTQYGWYSKMGQSVTIGFYIKANCNSGYSSTSISISGVPFTPLYPAAGGGMCSGAYVAANQNFQCYVAETNKTITTRTQSCNNTSATNLTTSASGCWYRSSGGEITLSGTISFIANS